MQPRRSQLGDDHVSHPLVATTLGTCRIADPVLTATRYRPLKRANQKVYGFAHTSREILQQVNHLEGNLLPEEFRPYLADPVGDSKGDVDFLADIYIVEISTTKEHRYRDWVLQTNYMERSFNKNSDLFKIFKSKSDRSRLDERRMLLEAHPRFAELSELQQSILLEGYVHRTTVVELRDHLVEIEHRLPAPVLFVCHVDVTDIDGNPLPGRAEHCANMRAICTEFGFNLLDPTPHVLAYNRRAALASDGRDANHYSLDFKKHYGCLIFDKYIANVRANAARLFNAGEERPVDANNIIAPSDALEISLSGPPAAASYTVASEHYKRGEYKMAESSINEVLRGVPNDIRANHLLLRILVATDRTHEALALASRLDATPGVDARILVDVAKAQAKAKHFDEAASARLRGFEMEPTNPTALAEAARYFNKAQRHVEALNAAERALDLVPDLDAALVQKAAAMTRLHMSEGLTPVLLALGPNSRTLLLRALPVLIEAGMFIDAAGVLNVLLGDEQEEIVDKIHAKLVRHLIRDGKQAAEANDAPRAVTAWRALLSIDPASKMAAVGLRRQLKAYLAEARRLRAIGDVTGSIIAYHAGLALVPDDERTLWELAALLDREKRWSESAEIWLRLVELVADEPVKLLRASRACRNAGRNMESLGLIRRLPEDVQADQADIVGLLVRRIVAAMRVYFADGNFDAAISHARAVLEVDSTHEGATKTVQKIISTLAQAMRSTEDLTAQCVIAERILAIEPGHAEAQRAILRITSVKPKSKSAIDRLHLRIDQQSDASVR